MKTPEEIKFNKAVGYRIASLLVKYDKTQGWLAGMCGAAEKRVQSWVSGERTLPSYFLNEIADAFGISPDWILNGDKR